jgi:hypothetical protein
MNDESEKDSFAIEQRLRGQAHYSRLFGERFSAQHSDDDLKELAGQMIAPVGTANAMRSVNSTTVYFGQFLDHDITRDQTRLETDPYPEPKDTPNKRDPRLNLDSLYADGPGGKKCDSPERDGCAVFDSSRPGAERFVLVPVGKVGFDIPRDGKANPWIGDPRNDENLIISQLHVLFMRFHNRVVSLLENPRLCFPAPGAGTIFERARRFVTWHYQWLVREEFLRLIIHRNVFSELIATGGQPKLFHVGEDTAVDLPVEFTIAAFRFGHSMVRDTYLFNKDRPSVGLSDILNKVARHLSPQDVIDWTRFSSNQAQTIDRTISRGLYGLSDRIMTLFRGPGDALEFALPARTLMRGARVGLPSGQEACKRAKVPVIAFSLTDRDYKVLNRLRMLHNTPLWYYLLYEAEMTGTNDAGNGALTLGPLGSRIVAEVILALLKSDKDSFVHHYWEPPAFAVSPGAAKQMIRSLADLIAFARGK